MRPAILLTLCLAACANDAFISQPVLDGSASLGPDGGPPPAAEDCLDGRDDNNDGTTDCEEPTCGPYVRCVPDPSAVPGWSGYSTVTTEPACPPEIPGSTDVWEANNRPASCPLCQCTAKGVCGTSVSVAESIAAGCMTITPFSVDLNGSCQPVPAGAGGNGNHWQMNDPGSGACVAADAGAPVQPAAHHAAHACSAARLGGGCPSGQVCAKRGAPGLCVSRASGSGPAAQCPAQFPIAHLTVPQTTDPAAAFVDRRACSTCSCGGTPSGGACTVTLSLYSDTNCGTFKGTVVSGGCNPLSCGATACKGATATVAYTPGTCTAAGGAPSGTVELASPGTQYCCDQ